MPSEARKACETQLTGGYMDEGPWLPVGIIETLEDNRLITRWGSVERWTGDFLNPEWWNTISFWGESPKVDEIEVLKEDRFGLLLNIGSHIARVIPIPTGDHVSKLSRSVPELFAEHMLLPVGGWCEDGDRILLFPIHDITPIEPDAKLLGRIHHSIKQAELDTPCMQSMWNARLKSIEDRLKTNTLWRAHFDAANRGIPHLGVSLEGFTSSGLRPEPRTLVEHLLSEDERLCALRDLALIEYPSALSDWSSTAPRAWSSKSALRTSRGGLWIQRYDVTLCRFAESIAFKDDDLKIATTSFLGMVDRIQAKLGVIRSVRGVSLLAAIIALSSVMLFEVSLISKGSMWISVIICSLVAILTFSAHRMMDPPP